MFKPLDSYIDFFLFQLPPTYKFSAENMERLRRFSKMFNLGSRMAVEFRDVSWFRKDVIEFLREIGATFVSIDAPIGRWIDTSNGIIYLRLHGRTEWYAYEYSDEELIEIAKQVIDLSPKAVYIFFNNDHWMLENARKMLIILTRK